MLPVWTVTTNISLLKSDDLAAPSHVIPLQRVTTVKDFNLLGTSNVFMFISAAVAIC